VNVQPDSLPKNLAECRVANLVSSAFYGGPERIMIGLAKALPAEYRSDFLVFGERGRGDRVRGVAMLDAAQREGFAAIEIVRDRPNLPGMVAEVASRLRELDAHMLCCHGYKADVIGVLAARMAGIPCVGIAHFWVASNSRLAVYMACDWLALRQMDATVAVCDAQADKLIAGGIRPDRIFTIRNAIDPPAIVEPVAPARQALQAMFPQPPSLIVGTAARLSTEKGIDVLVLAAEIVRRSHPEVGFVVCGDGPQRARLQALIAERNLQDSFVLAGFRSDVEALLPAFDLVALPSRSEGLPVAILEAMAAGIPVVATRVDGIPEAIIDGESGYLVPSEDYAALAERITAMLESDALRRGMADRAKQRVAAEFSFPVQAQKYAQLYDRVRGQAAAANRARAS
jgi:glycosyltransferase involved in cell wall biosynthesis